MSTPREPGFSLPPFRRPELLRQALTHKSFCQEHPQAYGDNERLEFLGDAILTFLGGEFLFQQFPEYAEGDLTVLRASLVDKTQLAAFAKKLNLGPQLLLSRGIEQSGGRDNLRLLSSAFEALIGAYYLDNDADISPIRQYLIPLFRYGLAHRTSEDTILNVKSRLQEWALANHGVIPSYVIVAEAGPDHAKQFTAEVQICGQAYGQGTGCSKQAAEKEAARSALTHLGEFSLKSSGDLNLS
jgi:ribonuclease-3